MEYSVPPEPEMANRLSALRRKSRRRPGPEPAGPPPLELGGARYEFAGPVRAEVSGTRLLDRTEVRRHSDHHKTRDAILASLH